MLEEIDQRKCYENTKQNKNAVYVLPRVDYYLHAHIALWNSDMSKHLFGFWYTILVLIRIWIRGNQYFESGDVSIPIISRFIIPQSLENDKIQTTYKYNQNLSNMTNNFKLNVHSFFWMCENVKSKEASCTYFYYPYKNNSSSQIWPPLRGLFSNPKISFNDSQHFSLSNLIPCTIKRARGEIPEHNSVCKEVTCRQKTHELQTYWMYLVIRIDKYIWVQTADNLQYNTLVRWDKWFVDLASDFPGIVFFLKFLIDLGHWKLFILIFVNL